MKVQNVVLSQADQKLHISWDLLYDTKVITINIANDSEFTQNSRYLCMPQARSATIDSGKGIWYVRIGFCIPSKVNEGLIEWSGIVGPIQIITKQTIIPSIKAKITVHYNQSVLNGIRLHTGKYENYYAVVEYSTGNFEASSTKTLIAFDSSRGYVDVLGLRNYNIYNVRIACFEGDLPKDSVKQVCDWTVVRGKKPMILQKAHDNNEFTTNKADEAILRDTNGRQNLRFSSGTDYANYLAAKARTISSLRKN